MPTNITEEFISIASTLISLISVLIAFYGVKTGYRIANFQIRFQRKSDAYDQFIRAFAAYVYTPQHQPKKLLPRRYIRLRCLHRLISYGH